MAVHLTRIYTRTGDAGTTGLSDGSRIAKTDPRIAAYADTDECNAAIGVALALGQLSNDVRAVLATVQNDLFDVGADLATPVVPDPRWPPLRITEDYILRVEGWCDLFNADLPKLDSFILPGGTPGAALLHVARTVARRAERQGWALYDADPERTNKLAIQYLNRLSDLLFILCRVANPDGDVKWVPGGERTDAPVRHRGPAAGAGPTGDGATEDGVTQDGATEDGVTQDGATEDGDFTEGA